MSRLDELTSWHSDWSGLRVAVLGLGVTGFAVADTLAELHASVTVVAARADDERRTIVGVLEVPIFEPGRDELPDAIVEAEVVVASPGLRPDHPWLVAAAERGIPVWGDIELAWRVRDKVAAAEWILVTGTNGKTTTTQLTAHMLREAGFRVAPVGNIGTPVLDAVRDPAGFDVLVVELSSFQLHWLPEGAAGELWPHSAVCLNIDDDHLDWHGSADAYRAVKAKVYRNARVAAVYNVEDPVTMGMVEEAEVVEGCRAIGFSLGIPGPSDVGLVEDVLVDRAFFDERHRQALELASLADLEPAGLRSPHMTRNVLAAAALARAFGADPAQVRDAIRSFRLDRHRTELVAEIAGVRFVDDSKATNPHAAEGSLSAFDRVVWIVGGLFKGADVAPRGAHRRGRRDRRRARPRARGVRATRAGHPARGGRHGGHWSRDAAGRRGGRSARRARRDGPAGAGGRIHGPVRELRRPRRPLRRGRAGGSAGEGSQWGRPPCG